MAGLFNGLLLCEKKGKKGKRKKVKDVILDMDQGRGYVSLSLSLPLALQWINRIRRTMDDALWTLSVEP